jgi:hypothetical protein
MPVINLDFPPDAARARRINARMHYELADSLGHVCEASFGELPFDDPAMRRLVASLHAGSDYAPSVFADYYELVSAIEARDAVEATRLFAALAQALPVPPGLRIVTLGGAELGEDSARYTRMMSGDARADLGFLPPSAQVASDFQTRLDAGLALLGEALPELSGELRAIVRQIVIAGSDPSKAYQCDGSSHYQLWGALFLNGDFHPDRVAVAEVLAHESAHSLLFGFCINEPLVENDDDDVYASPLRIDERPMDGIYHATFVSARMHWAMTQLAKWAGLSDEERKRALNAAAVDARNFASGYGVVAEHGRLTALGKGLMAAARAHMAGAA